jgi:hypothetical protein
MYYPATTAVGSITKARRALMFRAGELRDVEIDRRQSVGPSLLR